MEVNWRIVYDVLLYITRDDGGTSSVMISGENLPKRLEKYTYQEILYACNVLAKEQCIDFNVGSYQTIYIKPFDKDKCIQRSQELCLKLNNPN